MGILDWFREPLGVDRKSAVIDNPRDLLKSFEQGNVAGEAVNTRTAMQVSAVLGCARVIAEGLAQVPCKVYRDDATGSPVEDRSHPLSLLLKHRPNDWQTSFEFREQVGFHLVFTNNAYVYKNRVNGQIAELYAFQPNAVTVKQNDDLTLTYRVSFQNGQARDVPASDIWHLRGPSWNGYQGLDAVQLARKAIGLSMATETYGTKLFENGARPGVILTTRSGGSPLSPEQRQDIKEQWAANYQGAANAHKTVMLPYDLNAEVITGSANEAQWIENRKFLVEEVCRFFRVRPIMIMQSGATSYASVEQELLAHLQHTLMPWFERFEQSADANLFTPQELSAGYSIKLQHNAFLRSSAADRASYYQIMTTIGAMTANEVRALEDMSRSTDANADKLIPAANLFGGANKTPNTTQNDEVRK